jgi:hypothetical protein
MRTRWFIGLVSVIWLVAGVATYVIAADAPASLPGAPAAGMAEAQTLVIKELISLRVQDGRLAGTWVSPKSPADIGAFATTDPPLQWSAKLHEGAANVAGNFWIEGTNPNQKETAGVLLCTARATGDFLWLRAHYGTKSPTCVLELNVNSDGIRFIRTGWDADGNVVRDLDVTAPDIEKLIAKDPAKVRKYLPPLLALFTSVDLLGQAASQPATTAILRVVAIEGNDLQLQGRSTHSARMLPAKLSDKTVVIVEGGKAGTISDLKPDQWVQVNFGERKAEDQWLDVVRIEPSLGPDEMAKMIDAANEAAKVAYRQQAGLPADAYIGDFSGAQKPDGVLYEQQLVAAPGGRRVILTKTLPVRPKPELIIRADVPLDKAGKLTGQVSFDGTRKPLAPLTISDADNGKTLKAIIGQAITVTLEGSQANTGWEAGKPDGTSVKPLKVGGNAGAMELSAAEFVPAKGAQNDAIGTYTFRFVARNEGKTTLHFAYLTPGGGGVPKVRKATGKIAEMQVTVNVATTATPPATQAASAEEILKAARQTLAANRKKIEDAGNGRGANDPAVVDAGFEYMAAHRDDATVAEFDPLSGFTHYTVSKNNLTGETYLLVERIDGQRGGLNLQYDPTSNTITNVKYWGVKDDAK